MAPPRKNQNHDDKPDTPHEGGGGGAGAGGGGTGKKNGHTGGTKMRRGASSTGSSLREVTNAAAVLAAGPTSHPHPTTTTTITTTTTSTTTTTQSETSNSGGLQWPAFEREVLHAYRRAYRLQTPTAYANPVHQWVLTQPGSVGLYSPTIARRREYRRQSKDQLTSTVRKHFNGLGVQENDIIVDFLHKIRTSQGVPKRKVVKPREYITLPVEE
ncbi:hypothetical protein NEUTE1DRAFT_116711 [Neurospora tetrasperma FGSC 2508]|uniref:Histone deacetylase complex subunit SAP30 Sin3 binding domain-containing protein n=1 Tax=Neurospora tetrasperma (strain FGSC 2508 / ATCC MYA-4615 / P0657) TaxID=510951 RepID=F8MJF7_NEUT8|nr:uncharacterized protein NEUTE1DRAFT_116711 [Neurospora tetrasperma FGSC 2508]EGO59948.1 hypothetical protein NEUTE1DRAFT_116711 [Neurospora tetrasperma FGSC 2508]EGZ74098.1 hypothetical protein NEUTE2DRAFT_109366 [Neurospora tetrasperma FGSC 2509]